MILVKVPQVSYDNEIVELVKVFFTGVRVSSKAALADMSEEDLILDSTYTNQESGSFSFYASLSNGQAKLCEHNTALKVNTTIKNGEHRTIKNGLKGCVYDLLSSYTGRQPKWGILTGIRPVKIIHELLDTGYSIEDVRQELQDIYRMHPSKVDLAIRTAKIQRPLIGNPFDRIASIYIHIPFCSTRCLYCSFPSDLISRVSDKMSAYLDCLEEELTTVVDEFSKKGITVDTIYIGGGTPTVLEHSDLERMLKIVKECIGNRFRIIEYTVEAGRPDSLDEQKLQLLKKYGVTRLSINPQTMNQETLDLIGRGHTIEDIINIYELSRKIDFDSINMDVILGLPGETAQHMNHTMKEITALQPDNVTIHILAIKRASVLKDSFRQYDPSRQGLAEEMAAVCSQWIEKLNMVPYYLYRQKYMLDHLENVGYSSPGKECLYNIHIMEEKRSIWAFGAGAASKVYYPEEDRLERIPNVKNLDEYINRIGEMIEKKLKVLRNS